MLRALYTAATGMEAQQVNIDTIANNIANVNTTGFKSSRAEFQDLLYQNIRPAGTSASTGTQHPVGLQLGLGTRPVATTRIYSQGDFQQTSNPLDLVIAGPGILSSQTAQRRNRLYPRRLFPRLNSTGAMVDAGRQSARTSDHDSRRRANHHDREPTERSPLR